MLRKLHRFMHYKHFATVFLKLYYSGMQTRNFRLKTPILAAFMNSQVGPDSIWWCASYRVNFFAKNVFVHDIWAFSTYLDNLNL